MLRWPGGTYTSRPSPRASFVVTSTMWNPSRISEKSRRRPPSIHDSEDAFLNRSEGCPPRTGTSQMSNGS